MRVRGGLRRLAALVLGGVLIVFVVDTRPEWRGATGRVVPAPPGGRPHLVEVVGPEAWLPVTGWTDRQGRFFLFMAQVGAPHTLLLVVALGAGVGGWWTSERGWPAEAVAVVAGALSVYLGAVHLDPPLSSLAVVLGVSAVLPSAR